MEIRRFWTVKSSFRKVRSCFGKINHNSKFMSVKNGMIICSKIIEINFFCHFLNCNSDFHKKSMEKGTLLDVMQLYLLEYIYNFKFFGFLTHRRC